MDDVQQPEDKPRFLLPHGCKDLIDAIRPRHAVQRYFITAPQIPGALDILPVDLPDRVTLPSSLRVGELASALRMQTHQLISALLKINIFVSAATEIDFSMASAVCFRFGVSADMQPKPGKAAKGEQGCDWHFACLPSTLLLYSALHGLGLADLVSR